MIFEILADIRSFLNYLGALGVHSLPKTKGVEAFLAVDFRAEARSIPELEARIKACQNCHLRKTCSQPVAGEGPQQTKLMIVGEAPGREEDREGRPFVGRAGQMLDQMLKIAQIDRTEVYITNVVKCRPPENRTPTEEEIKACLPYLKKQIEFVSPRLILALGAVAAKALIESSAPLSKLRGKVHEKDGLRIVVTYHPAYLLRYPGKKLEGQRDLLLLKKAYQASK